MTSQTCIYNICFPVPEILGGLIPGASSPGSSSTASPTPTQLVSSVSSAVQTVTQAGGTARQTVTQVITQTIAGAGTGAGATGAAGAAGGLPTALPSGFVLPDNFQLPAGFQLPPKPAYEFDVDDRLAEAVIYAILLFPTIYLLWKHGKRGLLIWPALAAFCIVRIAADAIHMWPSGDIMKVGAGWIVTTAISLMLLVMLPAGLNFEAGSYIPSTSRVLRIATFVILGFFSILGLIMGTIGSVPLSLLAQIRNKPYNLKMARAGYIIMLLVLVFSFLQSLYLFMKSSRPITPLSQRKQVRALLLGSIFSIPFLAVRVGRSIDFSFNYMASRNVISGSFVTIFVFVFLMQLLAFIVIFAAGFVSHRIKGLKERTTQSRSVTGDSDSDLKAEEVATGGRKHRFGRSKKTVPSEGGYYDPKPDEVAQEV